MTRTVEIVRDKKGLYNLYNNGEYVMTRNCIDYLLTYISNISSRWQVEFKFIDHSMEIKK